MLDWGWQRQLMVEGNLAAPCCADGALGCCVREVEGWSCRPIPSRHDSSQEQNFQPPVVVVISLG